MGGRSLILIIGETQVVVAKRSNNLLDTTKLEQVCERLGLELPRIHAAVRVSMHRISQGQSSAKSQEN